MMRRTLVGQRCRTAARGLPYWGGRPEVAARRNPVRFVLVALVLLGASTLRPAIATAGEPAITNLSPDRYFSPNGDGQEDTTSVSYQLAEAASVTVTVRDSQNSLVKTVQSNESESAGYSSFAWDGHTTNGSTAANGVYTYTIQAGSATATGRIGVDKTKPGSISSPTPGQIVSGNVTAVLSPTAGENVTEVTFFGRSCRYYYEYARCYSTAFSPEPDGTFGASIEAENLYAGENGIEAYVYFTDAFGQQHSYRTPSVPVTVAYPEQISGVSPDRYFSPNGDGQEDTASVSYSLLTSGKVSAVVKNGSGQPVKTVLSEAEQGPNGGSFSWDGTNESGQPAPEGVYTYTITAAGASGVPATATGRIGVDRHVPGTITTPASGATLNGTTSVVFTPTAGENVTEVTFFGRSCRYYYEYARCYSTAFSPEPDGTFGASLQADNFAVGGNDVEASVQFTDPFGQRHYYSALPVPVTLVHPTLEMSAEIAPTSGPAPLAAKLKIQATVTPTESLAYSVDFGDGSAEQEGALPTTGSLTLRHTYTIPGVYEAHAQVFDTTGHRIERAVQVTAAASEKSVPVNTLAPTIAGTAREGETLTEEHGAWTGSPTGYTYQWLRCDARGASCTAITGATHQTYVLVTADVGHTSEVRETAKNSHGAGPPATSSHTAVVVPPVPTNVTSPKITGSPIVGHWLYLTQGTWTHEPTSYSYQWLRCAGADCTPIAGATGSAYAPSSADVDRTIKVEETASNAGGHGAPAVSAATTAVSATPLKASAGETVYSTQGIATTLDGSGSSPAQAITSYHWELGDATTATGAIVSHVYKKAGIYTATLTVSDGISSQSSSTTVIVEPPPAHTVEITATDTSGQPLQGVEVLYVSPSGQKTSAMSGSTGIAKLPGLPDGEDTIYAYEEGFQPAVGRVGASGGSGKATIALTSGSVVASTLSNKEMNLQEIEAAGIDTSNPANQHVYGFEVRLAFFEEATREPPPIDVGFGCHINENSEFVGVCNFTPPPGKVGEGEECSATRCSISIGRGHERIEVFPEIVGGRPLIEWLILRGKVTVLKQFTTAALTVQNLAPEPFKLTRGSATLLLPSGLSLAPTPTPQAFTQTVPDIPGGGSATTSWIVRGDEPGSYRFSAEYKGQLEPVGAPVDILASLAEPWRVWGVEAFKLSVKADSGKLHPGVPYHVIVGVTNQADIPFYNVNLSIESGVHANFDFQPDERFNDATAELRAGQTLYSHRYVLLPDAESVGVFNPSLSSVTFDGEIAHPGENIEAMTPPPLYAISAPNDTPNMIHLHWEAVPGAEGYEVFSTPDLDTAFGATPDHASTTAGGTLTTEPLPTSATNAYLAGTGGTSRYYAVTAVIGGIPTLELPAIADSAGGTSAAGLPELGRCTTVSPVKEGTKTVYNGAYTTATCTTASTTKTGHYEWLPGPGPKRGITGHTEAVTLETVGKVKIKCAHSSSAGEVTGAKRIALTTRFTGCARATPAVSCQTYGAASGEIVSDELEDVPGYIKNEVNAEGRLVQTVGTSLRPAVFGGRIAGFQCGETTTSLTGDAAAAFTAIDKMSTTAKLAYKAAKGVQLPEELLGQPKESLVLALGKTQEQVGLTVSETLTAEEAIEVKAR
jgi:PKD repeat protein/flagellar hook assembly protein FlgD